MLTSKEVLEKTGISRATLNNYIGWGLVPKPQVLPPEPRDGAAPRIGYFPEEIVARIADIQRLKSEGWSMARITEHFSAGPATLSVPAPATAPPAPSVTSVAAGPGAMPRLSVEEIAHPAYLVNHSFEMVWSNAAARSGVLRKPGAADSRPAQAFSSTSCTAGSPAMPIHGSRSCASIWPSPGSEA